MDNLFLITDLSNFIDTTRIMVFMNFGKEDNEIQYDSILSINELSDSEFQELNKILSYKESFLIAKEHIKKQKNKKSLEIRYIISNKNFMNIINDLHSRMISNILKSLVEKGLVESAFDANRNDFIFWIKDENQTQEQPETD